jgi:integrase
MARPRTTTRTVDDPLLSAFLRRLTAQGRARKGRKAYEYQLRSMVLIAARLAGGAMTCADLMQDENLLGRVLVDDTAPTLGTRLSRWTLAQRRSAIRDFVTLMRPELKALVGEEPHERLDRALRTVAERVGAGYRLTGGAPRRRGGRAPSETQIRDVLDAVGRTPGYRGVRNRAFFLILAETGSRVNALRELDGADCVEMPSGRMRLFLHEKSKGERREVELSRVAAAALRAYSEAFNYHAAVRQWPVRVRLGEPGAVWRNSPRGRWSDPDLRATLGAGCSAAEVPAFTPHALRRAFATDAASVLPRHTVAQAGGWQGLERLDDHYVQPRAGTIRSKLTGQAQDALRPAASECGTREAARALWQ